MRHQTNYKTVMSLSGAVANNSNVSGSAVSCAGFLFAESRAVCTAAAVAGALKLQASGVGVGAFWTDIAEWPIDGDAVGNVYNVSIDLRTLSATLANGTDGVQLRWQLVSGSSGQVFATAWVDLHAPATLLSTAAERGLADSETI